MFNQCLWVDLLKVVVRGPGRIITIKSRDITLPTNVHIVKGMVFQ